jgi:NAD(P)-dependent dehydrogenase (short-subunit alcohol dehydrogenase family)
MKQKVAIITGGATGIGKATALLLAREGVKVIISGRRKELGQQVVAEIQAQGGEAVFTVADVDKESDVRRMIEFAVTQFGR